MNDTKIGENFLYNFNSETESQQIDSKMPIPKNQGEENNVKKSIV